MGCWMSNYMSFGAGSSAMAAHVMVIRVLTHDHPPDDAWLFIAVATAGAVVFMWAAWLEQRENK